MNCTFSHYNPSLFVVAISVFAIAIHYLFFNVVSNKVKLFCFTSDMLGSITIPEFDGNSFIENKLDSNVGKSLAYEIWFLATGGYNIIL